MQCTTRCTVLLSKDTLIRTHAHDLVPEIQDQGRISYCPSSPSPYPQIDTQEMRTDRITSNDSNKSMIRSPSFALLVALLVVASSAFTVVPSQSRSLAQSTSTQLNFFGTPKDDGKPGDYVCLVSAPMSDFLVLPIPVSSLLYHPRFVSPSHPISSRSLRD